MRLLPHIARRIAVGLWLSALVVGIAVLSAESTRAQFNSTERGQSLRIRQLTLHRETHSTRRAQYVSELQELSTVCRQTDQPAGEAAIARILNAFANETVLDQELPRSVEPDIPTTASPEERHWRTKLASLSADYAADIYRLSRRALNDQLPTFAFELVQEAAFCDSDHAMARKILGFVRNGNEWLTPFEKDISRKYVWHDRFGWLPKAHVQNYENGLRFYNNRWLSVAQEAEIRRDFDHAWEVRTEHYLVKTNHSLERGVEVASALEDFYDHFVKIFAAVFSTPDELQKRFRSGPRGYAVALRPQFVVHYYATKDEYVRRLIERTPQIAVTNGLYYTTDRTAYFFDDGENNVNDTLYHEATHQILYECENTYRDIAKTENFWIVEGIACYMESFRTTADGVSLGDPHHIRLQNARDRFLTNLYGEKYYMPLAQLSALGMDEFQKRRPDELGAIYSQAAGLTHFFMHAGQGKYRDAVVEHISQIYHANHQTRNRVPTLAELIGVDNATLDAEYGQYLVDMQARLNNEAGGKRTVPQSNESLSN